MINEINSPRGDLLLSEKGKINNEKDEVLCAVEKYSIIGTIALGKYQENVFRGGNGNVASICFLILFTSAIKTAK